MISKIGFQNIRVFKNLTEFELKPLTILTGTNNSGKSTIHKMLKLLKNSFSLNDNQIDFENLKFDQNILNEIGSFETNKCRFSKNKNLEFTFQFEDEFFDDLTAKLSYKKEGENSVIDFFEICKSENILFRLSSQSFLNFIRKIKEDYDSDKKEDDKFEYNVSDIKSVDLLFSFDYKNINIDDFVHNIHNSLLDVKNNGLLQNKILLLDNKLENNGKELDLKNLNRSELRFYNELIDKGIKVQSEQAREEISNGYDEGISCDYDYFVWDIIKNKRIPFRYAKRNFSEVFLNPYSDQLLINCRITDLVLGKKDILHKEYKDEFILALQKSLYESEITTKEDFIKSQNKIEEFLIFSFILKFNSSQNWKNGYSDFDILETSVTSLSDILSKRKGAGITSIDEMKKYIDSDGDAFDKFFFKDLTETIIKNPPIKKDNLSKVELRLSKFAHYAKHDFKMEILRIGKRSRFFDKNLLQIFSEEIHAALDSQIASFNTALKLFVENIDFSLQNTIIKRNFIFSEAEINNPFLKLGYKKIKDELLEKQLDFINKWLLEFKIGEELLIEPIKVQKDIIGVSFFIKDEPGIKIPLGDNGLGINKVIEILINIAMSDKNKIMLLEEPESNLHPALQSKLAELFADAFKTFGIHFIIETHSEYLIRKMQYLIASDQSDLVSSDVSVYYLHDPKHIPKGEKQVYKLDIREDGFINNDFGKGFFDEASTLSLGLLNLKNFN